ncbi:hypothetical protein HD806DRAFT_389534 [Xylariaceae sp. AK1471]|nr:hypothetical protein HD806DRAFT_389534 [Xylariaceae sp. AK1471]
MTDAAGLAISLAGTVLKLVIFSIEFVGDAKQVYRQGATDRNLDLVTVAKSVEDATTSLDEQLDAIGKNGFGEKGVLDPDEEQLRELSMRAADIGRELAQKLRKVTTDEKSKWKSFKAVALGMWDADEIEKTEKRLNGIKDEIQFRILVSIRNKVNQSHDEDNSRMLAALEEVANLQAGSKEDSKRMIQMLNNADKVGEGRHEDLVQLGNQLLNAINAISVSRSPSPKPPVALTSFHDEKAREAAESIILNSLWYSSIRDREETISEAHAETFRWIFEDPKTAGKPWDSFVNFLTGHSSSFWITGKPGSGKSTLMKFINQNPRTQILLEQWAGEGALIKASYYFYYNGGRYQKSELGLIRSLLHSVLDQRRDLIPLAFKDRFQAALEGKKHEEPSLPEAKKALKDLMLHSPNLGFFFSIDGLDEFDPAVSFTHVQSLIDFTHFLEECKNVKLLISSRPLPEFERGYNGRLSLRAHDLTKEDIRQYAMDKLMNHSRMEKLTKKDPNSTKDLLQSIVESSLGVFLWVRLVTESLLEGLTNYDSISDLQSRLKDLPSDLEDLYSTMLSRVDLKYRPQTARLLHLVHHAYIYDAVTLLDLWFADTADNDMVYQTQVKPIEDEEVRERVQELETRLKSRCLGLIEAAPTTISEKELGLYHISMPSLLYDVSTDERKATARFLHRSVYEFLSRNDVWDEFVEKYMDSTFSASLSFFRSAILVIKTCRLAPGATWATIIQLASRAGSRAERAELATQQPHLDLVHELDLTMQNIMPLVHLSAKVITDRDSEAQDSEITSFPDASCHWSVWPRHLRLLKDRQALRCLWPMHDKIHGSIMSFAAEFGLQYFIQSEITINGREILNKKGLPLLGYALMPLRLEPWTRNHSNQRTTKFLLDEGSDPNELYKGTTLWEWYLWALRLDTIIYTEAKFHIWSWVRLDSISVMGAMILAGARPNGLMTWCPLNKDRLSRKVPVQEWGLVWYPLGLKRNGSSICTILLALTRAQEMIKDEPLSAHLGRPSVLKKCGQQMQKVIESLEKRGALKKEWKDESSIKQLILEVCQKIDDKGPPTIAEGAAVTEQMVRVDPEVSNPDTTAATKTPSPSMPPEVPSDSASSTAHETNQRNGASETPTEDKEMKNVDMTTSNALVNIPQTNRGWRKWYKRLFRGHKNGLK